MIARTAILVALLSLSACATKRPATAPQLVAAAARSESASKSVDAATQSGREVRLHHLHSLALLERLEKSITALLNQ